MLCLIGPDQTTCLSRYSRLCSPASWRIQWLYRFSLALFSWDSPFHSLSIVQRRKPMPKGQRRLEEHRDRADEGESNPNQPDLSGRTLPRTIVSLAMPPSPGELILEMAQAESNDQSGPIEPRTSGEVTPVRNRVSSWLPTRAEGMCSLGE